MDAWKRIAEELDLKSAKEAIFEFLRIEDQVILEAKKYLIDYAKELAEDEVNVDEVQQRYLDIEPYSQVDQLFLQCNLLADFAEEG